MSFLETPTASLKNFMCRGERATQGQSQLLAVPSASPKTLGVREERPAFHAGFQIIVFRLVRDVVANHKTTRYAGAATKVIQKNHLA